MRSDFFSPPFVSGDQIPTVIIHKNDTQLPRSGIQKHKMFESLKKPGGVGKTPSSATESTVALLSSGQLHVGGNILLD